MIRLTDIRTYTDEITKWAKRTRAEIAAETKLDYCAVALIGMRQRVPRYPGDNEMCWPCRVVTTKDPKTVHKKPDAEQPIPGHDIVVLEVIWTVSEIHAKRLKDRLVALMLGESKEAQALRHSWIHVEHPTQVWGNLLPWALHEMRGNARSFDVFTDAEYRQIVTKTARGRV